MTVTLVTFAKDGEAKSFKLEKKTTVVGRKTDADLRIPLADISRTHCELALDNGSVLVRDLDSSNGTFVNGEQVDEAKLKAGDEVRLGPITFVVQIDGNPANIKPPAERVAEKMKAEAKKAAAAPTAATKASSAPKKAAAADAGTKTGSDTDEFDIDDLDDLDIDDLSDLDLDDELDIDDELEEIDDLEEVDEDEVID